MVDLLFVVENSKLWHEKNLARNKHHYSGATKLFGSNLIDVLNSRLVPVHFNPFVKMEGGLQIKYGVV